MVAYIGVGLGVSHASGSFRRLAEVGAWLGMLVSLWLCAHGTWRLVPIPDRIDPASQLRAGPLLAEGIAAWSLPSGRSLSDGIDNSDAIPILTERYQEAAWIRYYGGIEAWTHQDCGRVDQFDLWDRPTWEPALFVRPATSGSSFCGADVWRDVTGPVRYNANDAEGHTTGRYDVFELKERR